MTAAETWMGAKVVGAAGMTARSCSLKRLGVGLLWGIRFVAVRARARPKEASTAGTLIATPDGLIVILVALIGEQLVVWPLDTEIFGGDEALVVGFTDGKPSLIWDWGQVMNKAAGTGQLGHIQGVCVEAPNDDKLRVSGVRRGSCVVGGKAAAEAGAVTRRRVRCSAWLGAFVALPW